MYIRTKCKVLKKELNMIKISEIKFIVNEKGETALDDPAIQEISSIEELDEICGGHNFGCNTASCNNNGAC